MEESDIARLESLAKSLENWISPAVKPALRILLFRAVVAAARSAFDSGLGIGAIFLNSVWSSCMILSTLELEFLLWLVSGSPLAEGSVEGRGRMGLVCITVYLWWIFICPVVMRGSMSFSVWKVVPPKHSACRFLTTRALSLTEKFFLVREMFISPRAASLVCSSARRASWLLGRMGQPRCTAVARRMKETVAPESNVMFRGLSL